MIIEKYIYYFLIYSFFGWIIETLYVSILKKKFINRGFLFGPFCPIYGFSTILIIYFVFPFQNNLLILFIFSTILISLVEFFTSYFLEKLFHLTWWDYSQEKFNLQGRICLKNSFYWGILSVLILLRIHPSIDLFSIFLIKIFPQYFLSILIIIYFIIDTIYTILLIQKLNQIIKKNIQKAKINFHIKRIIYSFSDIQTNLHNEIISRINNDIKKN